MNIAVDPDHRGRGIATMLLERLFELTADDARRGYTLEVRVSNATAISLYERLGFEARGIRRGYYTDNREDALIMWKDGRALRARLGRVSPATRQRPAPAGLGPTIGTWFEPGPDFDGVARCRSLGRGSRGSEAPVHADRRVRTADPGPGSDQVRILRRAR